ncbi:MULTISPECIES: DUF1329 domain-containing protein [Burkholderia cepacia complex]|uniref:DUF1329 domain-containing protein n=1 Tax=Burkholderia orbicola (strain MC0-3) TaxID=406425 RepID=B1KCM1_BURO0|nr:protein of unknown function DUF1329 [Burkholderia orbicola MC0-3]MBY4798460.1 DUF1329 domain-containing protein [Burkholderia cepacia]
MEAAVKRFPKLLKVLAVLAAIWASPYTLGADSKVTPFGAEVAGNKDGSIPAYTGGVTQAPPGFKPDSGKWVDPFSGEKPVLQITAQNYEQYADKLSASSLELFKRYPTYRMDVYPTHRSASYPDWYLENSTKNAQTAKLEKNGLYLTGAFGGKPFPVPKNGQEALWDWELRYVGTAQRNNVKTWLVDSRGTPILAAQFKSSLYYPYFDTKKEEEFRKKGGLANWYYVANDYAAPARLIGDTTLFWYFMDTADHDQQSWEYNPGQRRVRVAPDLAYDTPNPGYSGAITMDDIQLFYGRIDRWDAKLVGKKEMYIPYNDYKQQYETPASKILTPHFINPDHVRWELHRVWVVDMKLKAGARHVYSRKTLYFDEDGGGGMMDAYDQSGKLYRGGFETTVPAYDYKIPYSLGNWFYDFNSGVYIFGSHPAETSGIMFNVSFPSGYFTPERLQSSGVR